MSRPRSRTRRESPQISRGRSSLVNSWKMVALCLTTTSRRRAPFILYSVSGEVCRFSSRPSLARLSLWRLSPQTPLRMSRQDPGQGGNPPRSAEVDLRRKTAGRWSHSVRLQHPEGEHSSSCTPSQGRYADLCQDPHWRDNHSGG